MSILRNSFSQITQGLRSFASYTYGIAAVLGLIKGTTTEIKFGNSPLTTVAETDMWLIGDTQPLYIFPDSAGEGVTVVSTEADTQTIVVVGLDEDGLDQSVTVDLTGTTPLALSGLWTAVNRMYCDDSTAFTGEITCQGDGVTSSNIFAAMSAADQQTVQAITKIPSDKVGVVVKTVTSMNKFAGNPTSINNCIFRLKTALPDKVFRTRKIYGLIHTGSSILEDILSIPILIGPGYAIKLTGFPSVVDTNMSGEISILLIDKNAIPAYILAGL